MFARLMKLGLVLVLGIVLGGCGAAESKPAPPTVVLFTFVPPNSMSFFIDTFKALGYEEGKNINFVLKDVGGDVNKLAQVAQEVVELKPRVVVSTDPKFTKAVLALTADIPIVTSSADPVAEGIVSRLQNHGVNVTGVSTAQPTGLQLELLLKLVPQAKRILVPYNSNNLAEQVNLGKAKQAAPTLGLELIVLQATRDDQVKQQLEALTEKVDAIFLP